MTSRTVEVGSSTTQIDAHPPTYAIVKTIAELEAVRFEALPPLYDYVCPEALDALVSDGTPSLEIEFEYMTYAVSVAGSGTVTITPLK